MTKLKKMILATDLSSGCEKAVDFLNICCDGTMHLTLLHVISNEGFSDPTPSEEENESEKKLKMARLEKLKSKLSCQTEIVILEGNTINSIIDYVEQHETDMLVLGHKNYNWYEKLFFQLGREVKEIKKRVNCPILCC